MRRSCVAAAVGVCLLGGLTHSRRAGACGGGVVTVQTGNAGGSAQRIFFSLRATTTDVITEIGVASTADYGVLLPVPAQPTLDSQPISDAELTALDQTTAPRIYVSAPSDGGGCGCPFVAGGSAKGGDQSVNVVVGRPVNIGPVTAQVLDGTDGSAVNTWLATNSFVIPAAQQPLIGAYAGPGRFFIAIQRSDSAPPPAESSVGVHFTLPGAQPALPLRFAQLGAQATLGFTVFVAAPNVVAPSDPFAALTLADLDASTLKTSYAAALAEAIAAHGQRAFVLEGATPTSTLAGRIGPGVEGLFDAGATLTRLSAVFVTSALTEDVAFDQSFAGTPPSVRTVMAEPRPRAPHGRTLGAAVMALAAATLRARRRGRA